MSIIRVFPRRTALTPRDPFAFVGDPPLFRPEADEVSELHFSTVFTWDRARTCELLVAWRQYYPDAKCFVGGPAWDSPTNGFTAGLYVKPGVTFTSRGCNNECPWCLVPKREKKLVEIRDFAAGYIVNDNNFLQTSERHRTRVYYMLNRQPRAAVFSGGLQASLITDTIADELRGIRISEAFLAADTEGNLKPLEKAVRRLSFLPRRKLRCYMLLAFGGETIEQAEARLERAWEIGVLPFAQLFQGPDEPSVYGADWLALQRKWQRPAAMFASHKQAQP